MKEESEEKPLQDEKSEMELHSFSCSPFPPTQGWRGRERTMGSGAVRQRGKNRRDWGCGSGRQVVSVWVGTVPSKEDRRLTECPWRQSLAGHLVQRGKRGWDGVEVSPFVCLVQLEQLEGISGRRKEPT